MKTAVIYGSTGTGKNVYSLIKGKYNVLYFVDENPNRIGQKADFLDIKAREEILNNSPDVVILGQLTGYEEAKAWLIDNGIAEEKIICQYIDLPSRARKSCLEQISAIFNEKGVNRGAVAELGVYRGDFAKVINATFPDRKFYLFDTFEGFPEIDLNYEKEHGLLKNAVGKLSNTSVEYVLNKMTHRENCIIRKGYFPDTAAGLENEQYAFVNIDVDLYKPILAGLEYFWPRMIENGYIFVHDYFSFSYDGARKAINEFAKKNNIAFVPIGDTLSIAFVKKGIYV
ncbi:methyltransferase [Lachnospiraceae bacterium]|nr:methyltransferase [Lachnospiraceae bacterium]